ncbi:MAG: hypothetical protein V4585_00850 [Bacteroidota bacterium]
MKRIIFSIIMFSFIFLKSQAQNPAYTKAMEGLVYEIQTTQFGMPLQPLANKIERIAATEKTEFLPNYWVAYCYLMDSYVEQDGGKKDMLLDKADSFLENADKLVKDNEEVEILRANLASARMAVSPQDRWMKYGGKVEKALNSAKKINEENPRIALLVAQGIFYTPEAYGGGKEKSKPVFEKALEQFAKFKPVSNIHPNWGETVAKWMLSQI